MSDPMQNSKESATPPIPQSTPSQYAHPEHSFNLQILIELQRSNGQISEAIKNIDKRLDKMDNRFSELESSMSNVKTTLAISAVVIAILLSVGGFMANKAWDIAVNHIEISLKK